MRSRMVALTVILILVTTVRGIIRIAVATCRLAVRLLMTLRAHLSRGVVWGFALVLLHAGI
jgi:hypothetical protein